MIQLELKRQGLVYVFLGNELGARSNEPSLLVNGKVSYDRLADSDCFKRGLQEVQNLSLNNRVAMMCAEREPLACHRTILLSRYLRTNGYQVEHILGAGTLETHDDTMKRLLRTLGLSESDMFKSHEEILAEAYTIQGKRIAYDPMKQVNQRSAEENAKVR